jgi:hypothetical protein
VPLISQPVDHLRARADVEPSGRNRRAARGCGVEVITFLSQWDKELHARGFLAGAYWNLKNLRSLTGLAGGEIGSRLPMTRHGADRRLPTCVTPPTGPPPRGRPGSQGVPAGIYECIREMYGTPWEGIHSTQARGRENK